jgi:thiazole synthase
VIAIVNGEPRVFPAPLSITALLGTLDLDPRLVAVEHNRGVIKRARYPDVTISDGDEVEIVAFVGGG